MIKFHVCVRFFLWLMMKLALGKNQVLRYMHIHMYAYLKVGFEKLKLLKDGPNHFLLVVMPRISP